MRAVRIVLRASALYFIGVGVFERVAPRGAVRAYQRLNNRLQLPVMGLVPGWGVVETTGRRTGVPRRVPVGGRRSGGAFWLVAGDGSRSGFVRNIEANPRVRVRTVGRWYHGSAHLLDDDDAARRALRVNPVNGAFVWLANRRADMRTVRIDLDDAAAR